MMAGDACSSADAAARAGAKCDPRTRGADGLEELKERWAKEQEALRERIVQVDDMPWTLRNADREGGLRATAGDSLEPLRLVGGLDISFYEEMGAAEGERGVAALAILSYPDMKVLHIDFQPVGLEVPYISGFLGFRECPSFQELLRRVSGTPLEPQVVLVDGFGVLHARGCGSASQLGVTYGIPTVGVGKSLVCVDGLSERKARKDCQAVLAERGSSPDGSSSGKTLGAAVCKAGTSRPIFVSVGHGLSLDTAVELVRSCLLHRIPEPIRQADLASREYIRNEKRPM